MVSRLIHDHPGMQPIEALSGILEAEALRDDIFLPQAVNCVAHSPRGQIGPVNDLLLSQVTAGFKDFEDQLRRRRKVLNPGRYG